jgi:NAD(P)-dependent dehydrogenase (short-subunit alcohol dehydrogenase family)
MKINACHCFKGQIAVHHRQGAGTGQTLRPALCWRPLGTHIAHKTDQIPMKRLGTPKEAASVVAFLAGG